MRGLKGLTAGISLSSKKEFVKLKLLQSGQAHEHEECSNCLYSLSIAQHCVCIHFCSGHNGLLCGHLGRLCGKCHRVQNNLKNAMCQGFG